LYSENLEVNPSKVPTGQIVLQNNLPLLNDMIPMINRTEPEKTIASQLNAFISIG
jgi:hypothetical protein